MSKEAHATKAAHHLQACEALTVDVYTDGYLIVCKNTNGSKQKIRVPKKKNRE